ncbi:MAG: ATP synthase F1 subunit gamma [Flammeovirgaceae bacterium]|nr:ATP synthase F1 subunit gamma [Flammeovirgaceae bacterium]|tara:strand:+ start:5731 stop:6594 length:864 start_codon:yes stop_codon:yes gene_type:complete
MPNIKEVKNRIGSVKSTQQLTKAMKMVAAAKLKKAQDKVTELRPYSNKLNEILSNLSGSINNKLFEKREVINTLIIVVASDKGLCGSFNSNIFKMFSSIAEEKNLKSNSTIIMPIGKKANDFFKKKNFKLIDDFWNTLNGFSYSDASKIFDYVHKEYINSNVDQVHIIYNEFKNVAVQKSVIEKFLPIEESSIENESDSINYNYLFEPNKSDIANSLIPQTLKTQILKSVFESNASEQGSRMTAMSQATDNAGELLKELKLTYNRTRQAAITKEILEIVGGAEALNQ